MTNLRQSVTHLATNQTAPKYFLVSSQSQYHCFINIIVFHVIRCLVVFPENYVFKFSKNHGMYFKISESQLQPKALFGNKYLKTTTLKCQDIPIVFFTTLLKTLVWR
jgi:hypothetical protein